MNQTYTNQMSNRRNHPQQAIGLDKTILQQTYEVSLHIWNSHIFVLLYILIDKTKTLVLKYRFGIQFRVRPSFHLFQAYETNVHCKIEVIVFN